jgi:hypothetical protein
VFEALGNDPQGESLDPCKRRLLRVAIREDAGQVDNFCQPPAIVLLLDFNRERNQQVMPSERRVYDDDAGPQVSREPDNDRCLAGCSPLRDEAAKI